jgi:hypothetical protein
VVVPEAALAVLFAVPVPVPELLLELLLLLHAAMSVTAATTAAATGSAVMRLRSLIQASCSGSPDRDVRSTRVRKIDRMSRCVNRC